MATWTLYLMETPLNTPGGQTGLVTPLTLASGVSMGYKIDDIDTLSFSVPGRHFQTGLIHEATSDIIAYRDDEVMQRFRVTSLALEGTGTSVTVNATCSAYREVVNAWMFHGSTDIGVTTFTGATDMLSTAIPHTLVVGDTVTFSDFELIALDAGSVSQVGSGSRWFVINVPSSTTFQISDAPGGTTWNQIGDVRALHTYIRGDVLDYPGEIMGKVTFAAATDLGTTTYVHTLAVGDQIEFGPITSTNGVLADTRYYVKTVPSSTTFTFSLTPGGSTVDIFTDGSTIFLRRLTATNDPVAVAWNILNEGQVKVDGDLSCTQGVAPVTALTRRAYEASTIGEDVNPTTAAHYFSPGQSRADGINQLANLDDGFEWAIEPDPADPWASLVFNTWNRGGRFTATAGSSDFVLSEASMASWSLTNDMSEYANVLRVSPNSDTIDGTVGGLDPPVWRPVTENPSGTGADPFAESKGRWEMDLTSTQYKPDLVAAYADEQLVIHQDRSSQLGCTLVPGRWGGKDDFWLGDSMRMLLQVALVDDENVPTGDYLIDLDDVVRAVGINITVGTDGSEQVTLELNRTSKSLLDTLYRLQGDVSTMKRR